MFFRASDKAISPCLVGCVYVNPYPSKRNGAGRTGPLSPFDRDHGATALGGYVCVTTTGTTVSIEGRGTVHYRTGEMKSLEERGTSL